jgi:hypothetical protein
MAEIVIVQGDGPVLTEAEERAMEERERYLIHVVDALDRLTYALRVILDDGAPDIDALEAGAVVLEDFARGKVAGPRPITDDDVAAAHHLIELVRAGAPKVDVITAAREVTRFSGLTPPPPLGPRQEVDEVSMDLPHPAPKV